MLVLVGRSCVGKDTIQKILCDEYGMERVVTCTTRPPRDGEVDGVDYHFIKTQLPILAATENKTEEVMLDCHFIWETLDFAETTKYHVASGETWYYGSLRKDYEDSDNKIIILNPDGLRYVRDKNLPVFVVEITAPDTVIISRQMARGDDPAEASRRFDADLLDFADISKYTDTCIINWGEGGADRCARNIYNLYQHWLSKQKGDSDVEN